MKRLLASLTLLAMTQVHAAEHADVMVENGHVRAMLPTVDDTSAYFTLKNQSDNVLTLKGARSDIAEKVELNISMEHDGQLMRMRTGRMDLPANGSLKLEDGGLHLMVFGLKKPLVPGGTVDLVLEFSDGSELPVSLPVQVPVAGETLEYMSHDDH